MRFTVSVAFAVLAAAGALGAQTPRPQPSSAHPDVFLITIDTLRADHVHCYGYDKAETHALDRLAHDGVRFTNAFTPSPITNTAHASILTGLYPSDHGVTTFGARLSNTHPTISRLLHDRGYQTAAFIGAVILDSDVASPGLDAGFDTYANFPPAAQAKKSSSRFGRVERRAADVVRMAEQWLATHRSGPRFVWLHLYDPHDPYEPPEPYATKYKDRLYDGEIAYADHELAGFLSFLDRNGWYDKSLIVAVGDHGEGLGEHGEDTHGIFLYDSTTHVPLLVKLPGSHSSSVITQQARTIDIAPTIAEAAHSAAGKFDGVALQRLFTAKGEDREAQGETDYPLQFGWAPLRSVRVPSFKYIEAPRPEFYDLKQDPRESHNVYEPWNAEVQRLRAELAAARERAPKGEPAADVPQSTIDELKALGYLGNDPGATTVGEPSLLPDPKDHIAEQNLLHTAMIAADSGDVVLACSSLRRVLDLDPKSASALAQLGELEFRAGNYADASNLLRRAQSTRRNDPNIALLLGEALEKMGDWAGARDALLASLKSLPTSVDGRLALARVYVHEDDYAAAQDQLEAATLVEPRNAEVQAALAEVYAKQGKAELAREAEQKAAQLKRR
jgi:arylsulfatase A-like enzyme/Tfp pilus assembly protein PilF